MATRGGSAREMQEEVERALRRKKGRGWGPDAFRGRFIPWAVLWLLLGVVITVVALPLLPDSARQLVDDVQSRVVEIRDSLTGSSE